MFLTIAEQRARKASFTDFVRTPLVLDWHRNCEAAMARNGLLPKVVRFGDCEVDTRTGDLRKGDTTTQLQEQPRQILVMLLGRPGELVTRDELRKALWPGDTFVDFEDSLNHAIRRLRDVLGDSAGTPRFIETLPRRGYRFIAPFQPVGEAREPPPRKRWVLTLGGLALIALVTVLAGLNVAGLRDRLLMPSGIRRTASPPKIESIAVLPLENLSHDPEQEYFAEGMTEALITNLGKFGTLRVISRTSVMRYKATKKPLPEIGRELNVDAILEGTVQRWESHIRITVNLLYAPSDRHLWAETYERDLRDVLALQGEVARAIASEIRIKVTPEQGHLTTPRPVNPAAYEAYIKGRRSHETLMEDDVRISIKYFEKAIELEPTYAAPYTGLADAYSTLGEYEYAPPREAYPRAKEAVAKALALDANLAEAYASLCYISLLFDWDWQAAQRDCIRALALNPNSATALRWSSHYPLVMGRKEECMALSRRYVERDPLAPAAYENLAYTYYFLREYDGAVEQCQKALALDPQDANAWKILGLVYAGEKMYRGAVTAFRKSVTFGDPIWVGHLGYAYAKAGERDEALKALDELKRLSKRKFVGADVLAAVYAGLGDKDQAFHSLAMAVEERDSALAYAKVEPMYDPLRSDRRFQDLLRHMNFPP